MTIEEAFGKTQETNSADWVKLPNDTMVISLIMATIKMMATLLEKGTDPKEALKLGFTAAFNAGIWYAMSQEQLKSRKN